MKRSFELIFYVAFSAGLAFGTSSFTVMSGLFETSAGIWVVVAIVLAGLLCLMISASVAELASMYPSAPGIRTYLKVAFSDQTSLLLVYLYLIFMVMVAGIESYMFALVLTAVFPQLAPMTVVLALFAFTIALNLLGFELPRGAQIVTTTLLIGIALAVGAYGVLNAPASPSLGLQVGDIGEQMQQLPGAIGLAVYLFVGFEWVTMLGFRPDSYRRLIPLSMPLAILTNVAAYSLFVAGMASQLPPKTIAASPVPQVPYVHGLLGAFGLYAALGLSLLAIFGTFNAGVLGGSRMIYVLTVEGNLPKWCGKMSLRTGAPIGGILVLGVLAVASSVIVVRFELELIAAVMGSCIVSFVYAAFMLAVLRLRKTQPNRRRTFRTPLYPWVQRLITGLMPIMGVLALFSLPNATVEILVGIVLVIALGLLLTRWSRARVQRLKAKAIIAMEAPTPAVLGGLEESV